MNEPPPNDSKSGNDPVSRHVFLFPFKWETGGTKNRPLSDKTDLDKFEKFLKLNPVQKNPGPPFSWKRTSFAIEKINHYNEFNYFYDYVREILYDLEGDDSDHEKSLYSKSSGQGLLRHYELQPLNALTYEIATTTNEKPYTLELNSVTLNIYETGVGVLTFFLTNKKHKDQGDILRINQFGRRIYPPFFQIPGEAVGKGFDFKKSFQDALEGTQKLELACDISIPQLKKEEKKNVKSFDQYHEQNKFSKGPFLLPPFIENLFPENVLITQEAVWESQKDKILLKPVLDDRMFVLCWYGNDEIFKDGDLIDPDTPQGDFWYKYLFVDMGSKSTFNSSFAREGVEKNTYQRWLPLTYYGISRYSLVCLTSSLETLRNNHSAFIPQHMESIYYKLFELSIVQRASVLRFADEVTHLSHFKGSLSSLAGRVENLYENYIRFVNKIYFREVTAQDQGIEMYDMLQREMRIEEQVEDLDKEIEELHTYISMREEGETAKKLNALTFLGALFLIPGFILTLYGMAPFTSFMESVRGNYQMLGMIFAGITGLGLTSLGATGILPRWLRQNRLEVPSRIISGILALIIALALLVYPLSLTSQETPASEEKIETAIPETPHTLNVPIDQDSVISDSVQVNTESQNLNDSSNTDSIISTNNPKLITPSSHE